MQELNAAWLYPLILIGGALQAWGPPMNGALRNALTNPWLASMASFLPIVALLVCLILCQPLRPAGGFFFLAFSFWLFLFSLFFLAFASGRAGALSHGVVAIATLRSGSAVFTGPSISLISCLTRARGGPRAAAGCRIFF
jgi:uncharacterized membrane protein YdcZ (DUF606 family)